MIFYGIFQEAINFGTALEQGVMLFPGFKLK